MPALPTTGASSVAHLKAQQTRQRINRVSQRINVMTARPHTGNAKARALRADLQASLKGLEDGVGEKADRFIAFEGQVATKASVLTDVLEHVARSRRHFQHCVAVVRELRDGAVLTMLHSGQVWDRPAYVDASVLLGRTPAGDAVWAAGFTQLAADVDNLIWVRTARRIQRARRKVLVARAVAKADEDRRRQLAAVEALRWAYAAKRVQQAFRVHLKARSRQHAAVDLCRRTTAACRVQREWRRRRMRLAAAVAASSAAARSGINTAAWLAEAAGQAGNVLRRGMCRWVLVFRVRVMLRQRISLLLQRQRARAWSALRADIVASLPVNHALVSAALHYGAEADAASARERQETGKLEEAWNAYVRKAKAGVAKQMLPRKWLTQMDVVTGKVYYLNTRTGRMHEQHPSTAELLPKLERQRVLANARLHERLEGVSRTLNLLDSRLASVIRACHQKLVELRNR